MNMVEETPQPVHKGIKKGLYAVPTAFTAANIGMGFLAVLSSLHGFQLIGENPAAAGRYFNYAAIAIALAMVFDTLDGRVARLTKTATEIGVQLDSLADVLTFGIAPTILAYSWGIGSTFPNFGTLHRLGLFVLFMYLMCGAFRLARFNIQATRPRVLKEGTPKVDKKNFVGLPIPVAAGVIAALVHFSPVPLISHGEHQAQAFGILLMLLVVVLGILMVSTLRYTSFKTVGTRRKSLYLVLIIGAIGMLVWLYSQYVLLSIAVVYVMHGIVWYIAGLFRRGKTEIETTSA